MYYLQKFAEKFLPSTKLNFLILARHSHHRNSENRGFRLIQRPCAFGFYQKVSGKESERLLSIENAVSGELALVNWCKWTAVTMTGLRVEQTNAV